MFAVNWRAVRDGWKTGAARPMPELLIRRSYRSSFGGSDLRVFHDGTVVQTGGLHGTVTFRLTDEQRATLEAASERTYLRAGGWTGVPGAVDAGYQEMWIDGRSVRYQGRPRLLEPMLAALDDILASHRPAAGRGRCVKDGRSGAVGALALARDAS